MKLPEPLADWLGLPAESRGPAAPIQFASPDLDDPDQLERYSRAELDRSRREEARRLGLQPKTFWPENRPYAVCVTHDIDRVVATYQRLREARTAPFHSARAVATDLFTALTPGAKERNVFFNFSRIERWERELGIRSAFYVLFERRRVLKALLSGEIQHALGVYSPSSISRELRRLQDGGWEIGLHCSFSSWNDSASLRHELSQLSGLGLDAATGARTHYLCFDREKTPAIETEAGLSYDSSVGFNFLAGFSAGTCFPFRLGGLWELPLHLMDTALRHLSRDHEERRKIARRIRDEVRAQNGVLVLNWHSHLLNPDFQPEMVSILEELILQAKKDGAWLALPRDVIQWWKNRVAS